MKKPGPILLAAFFTFVQLSSGGASAWAAPTSPSPAKPGGATKSALPPAPAKTHQIQVTLFGQPCMFQGTLGEPTLKQIHSVSPEQVYPSFAPEDSPKSAGERIQKSLQRLKSAGSLPSAFDHYREHLSRRLTAQAAFFEAFGQFKKTLKVKPVLDAAQKHFQGKPQQNLEAALKKVEGNAARKASYEPLLDAFNEGIEADPEEDFHRALRLLNLNYICSFEESGLTESETEDSETEE